MLLFLVAFVPCYLQNLASCLCFFAIGVEVYLILVVTFNHRQAPGGF